MGHPPSRDHQLVWAKIDLFRASKRAEIWKIGALRGKLAVIELVQRSTLEHFAVHLDQNWLS